MATTVTWPREALDNLGRPLNKWDLCPVCSQPAAEHFYNGLRQGELICPEPVEKMTANDYGDRVRRAEAEATLERYKRSRPQVSGATVPTKRQPDGLSGPRAYFDDEE